jgi:hypothetical protein
MQLMHFNVGQGSKPEISLCNIDAGNNQSSLSDGDKHLVQDLTIIYLRCWLTFWAVKELLTLSHRQWRISAGKSGGYIRAVEDGY